MNKRATIVLFQVWSNDFVFDALPSRTTVGVAKLGRGALVEIDLVGYGIAAFGRRGL